MSIIGECALCLETASLRESHVLPGFVFRWLKGRSPTGYIRFSGTPNRRVQDGHKKHWLCDDCEQRFNRHETAFATELFHPWLQGQHRVRYEDWLLKFCVSVSWRVLKHLWGSNPAHQYTDEQKKLAQQAEATWRAVLLDQAAHPGRFEQHLLMFDLIKETDIPDLPNNINRYLTGPIEMDIVGSDRTLMTYAKLGRFYIFGVIQKGANKWEGTKVHVKHGLLKPGSVAVPYGILGLIKERASRVAAVNEVISEVQHMKVESAVMANPDRLIGSEQFEAMMADLLPVFHPLIGRVCSGYGPHWTGLQTPAA